MYYSVTGTLCFLIVWDVSIVENRPSQTSSPLDFDDIMSSLALPKGWFTVSTNAESLCCFIAHIIANLTFQPAEADVTLKIWTTIPGLFSCVDEE